ncbi:MAG: DUF3152 domain-containing protein [Nitriliruptorales bacterium]
MERVGGRAVGLAVVAAAALLLSAPLVVPDVGWVASTPTGEPGVAVAASLGPPTAPPLAGVDAASRQAVVTAPQPSWSVTPDGFLVAAAETDPVGSGGSVGFTVEVEAALEDRLGELLEIVEEALFDPRSWTADGRHPLHRVGDPADARIRVVLATPATVDRVCARIGLDTAAGSLSCWDGRRAMLNAWRFDHGADHFDSVADYRRYLVNHEVGHGLGYDHRDCPRPGGPAPLMMQQTKSVGACLPNPWPHP